MAREHIIINYHPAGSRRLAPIEKMGVLDEGLKMHGVKNPRVVDASVFEVISRGTILTNGYAMAES